MNLNNDKTRTVLAEENSRHKNTVEQRSIINKIERFKKPIILGLMAVVFAGCMYLIFKPSESKQKVQNIGLNDAVPQATDAGLQPDKQKAYEQAQIEQKAEEKRNALASLSDYWNEDTAKVKGEDITGEEVGESMFSGMGNRKKENNVLNSYKNTQDALNSFYQDDHSETKELRKQIEELKQQLSDKEVSPPVSTIDNQLALMEKSYQMAAKYLPSNMSAAEQPKIPETTTPTPATTKTSFVAFTAAKKNPVSALYREPTDSAFVESLAENNNRGFYTAGIAKQTVQQRNSIRASVQETTTISNEGIVKLRLLEAAKTPTQTIPAGSVITAIAKFQNGRLELKVSSIESDGNIMPVDITGYDLDGQPGLFVPYSPERNALKEIAGNMSQTSGTSLMMTQSASQQVAGDLSRGLVQGVSGYFSKKIRAQKVILQAGLQVLLVSK